MERRKAKVRGLSPLFWFAPLLLAVLAALLVFRPGNKAPEPRAPDKALPVKAAEPHFPDAGEFQAAMAELNDTFMAELDQVLEAHSADHVSITGPEGGAILVTNWRDIAAAYVMEAESAALDKALLERLFREMVKVSYTEKSEPFTHTEQFPSANGTLREVEITSPETVIQAETACAPPAQTLEDKYDVQLNALLGRTLTLTQEQNDFLAPYLPQDIAPMRTAMVRVAYALVGRVRYFWGGKSATVGWDGNWGAPSVVTSAGSDTSGTVLPLGLDCSGLVSWAAVTAAGDAKAYSVAGDGVRDQRSRCAILPWDEAQPGDLVFFPDQSHIGIAVGFGDDGKLRVVHCSYTLGGVVLSEDAAAIGFTEVGRPALYG